MPEIQNSYAKQPTQQKQYHDRLLLERLLEELYFYEYGTKNDKKSIPKHEGDTINLRRFNSLPIPLLPLTEGVTPAGSNLSISSITATVRQEGNYVTLSDKIQILGIDDVSDETTELVGENAAQTIDRRIRNVIFSGTNVYYVGGHLVRGDVEETDILTGAESRRIRQIMGRNIVKPIPGIGSFIGFTHPDSGFDFKGSPEWSEPHTYVDTENIYSGEIGKLHNIRWIETTECPIHLGAGDAGADVYCSLVIGKGAYGVVDIEGSGKPEIIIHPLGSGGSSDALNQRSTVGWKALFTSVRLNELCMLRIEHSTQLFS